MNAFPKSYRFADVLSIINGRNQKKVEAADGQYPIYGSGGIMGWANDYICPENTVVIGRKGSINNPIYVDRKFWNVDTAFGLVPNRNLLLPRYLFYFCVCFDFEKLNTTVTIPSLTKTNLLQIKMFLPSLGEQEKIICRLDKLCHLIELKKEQLKQLDVLAKSRFIEMFGDPVENPKGWSVLPISSFAKVKIGPFGSSLHAEDYVSGGYPLVNPSHIIEEKIVPDEALTLSEKKYRELSAYHLELGDIVLGRRGEIGRCALVTQVGLFCGTGSMFVRIMKDCRPDFLQRVISHPTYKAVLEDKAVGGTMKNLNAGMIENSLVALPPLALQNEFAAFIEQLDKSKFTIRRSLEKLEMLYQALLQEYFG